MNANIGPTRGSLNVKPSGIRFVLPELRELFTSKRQAINNRTTAVGDAVMIL